MVINLHGMKVHRQDGSKPGTDQWAGGFAVRWPFFKMLSSSVPNIELGGSMPPIFQTESWAKAQCRYKLCIGKGPFSLCTHLEEQQTYTGCHVLFRAKREERFWRSNSFTSPTV